MKVGATFVIFLVISFAAIVGLVFLAFRIHRRRKRQKSGLEIVISVHLK